MWLNARRDTTCIFSVYKIQIEMNFHISALTIIVTSAFLAACGGGGDNASTTSNSAPTVAYSKTETIQEGQLLSVTLPAGKYRAEITSSNNGVIVSWVGGSQCAKSIEVIEYANNCELTIQGQLLVENPTTLGLGGAEIATVKILKL
jgi:hypothetical protein